jgi:hypothetical protein
VSLLLRKHLFREEQRPGALEVTAAGLEALQYYGVPGD